MDTSLNMKPLLKLKLVVVFVSLSSGSVALGQERAFMPLYKVAVNFHNSTGFELGLVAFNYIPKGTNFLETGISTEGIFKSDFLLIPKFNLEGGVAFSQNGLLMIVGGMNLGFPTDFKNTDFLFSPKIGLSYGSFIRIYYSYNSFANDYFRDRIGHNQIGIEINIATFHDLKIGI